VNGHHLVMLGVNHVRLADYQQAIDLLTQGVAIQRDTGDRQREANALGNLAICHFFLGDYRKAIDLYTQVLAIHRDVGDRLVGATALTNLGLCHVRLGDYQQAIDLLAQGLVLQRDISDRRERRTPAGHWKMLAVTGKRREPGCPSPPLRLIHRSR
jgi:tetratricopeptide (TPR) repeat protein